MEAMLGKMEEEKGRRKTTYIVGVNGEGKVRGQGKVKEEGKMKRIEGKEKEDGRRREESTS